MSNAQPALGTTEFIVTKEYRRFAEFCDACRRYRYIGLCYGAPGVGKTVSARHYARVELLEPNQQYGSEGKPVPAEVAECHTVFYTPPVANSPRQIERHISVLSSHVRRLIYTLVETQSEEVTSINLDDYPDLIVVDEADRLKLTGLEQLRDIYDRQHLGLVLLGMPGIEKRLARYPQFYSRVGFVHHFRPLSGEELRFILAQQWQRWHLTFQPEDFTDAEAVAAIIRITAGNFRLVQRLLAQVERILQINELRTVTKEVVETAREQLVIGVT